MKNLNELPSGSIIGDKDRVRVTKEGHEAYMQFDDLVLSIGGNDSRTLDVGPGPGITAGTGTICEIAVGIPINGVVKTEIILDLTGLNSGGTAGDIIGKNGTGAAYLCKIDYAKQGTLFAGKIECLETPAGGDTDFDIYSATEATGVEDTAITALAETELVNAGAHAAGGWDPLVPPVDGQYLYLVNQGTANATYTAGKFVITFWGLI